MIKTGITGIIGSGKTTVAKAMEAMDIPVYYSDERAKDLYALPRIKEEMVSIMGQSVLDKNGNLSLKKMGNIIFQDNHKLKQVNKVIHPMVTHDFQQWADQQKQPIVAMESALLFEANLQKLFDYIITVSTPEKEAIERVIKRDKCPEEQVKQRMNHQWSNQKKLENANFVIQNYNNNMVLPQLLNIIEEIRKHTTQ